MNAGPGSMGIIAGLSTGARESTREVNRELPTDRIFLAAESMACLADERIGVVGADFRTCPARLTTVDDSVDSSDKSGDPRCPQDLLTTTS
jgi:hypothetical protein